MRKATILAAILSSTLTACGAEVESDSMKEPPISVESSAACCYVMCRSNTYLWYGPAREVRYGNCGSFCSYYCGQKRSTCYKAKWDNC